MFLGLVEVAKICRHFVGFTFVDIHNFILFIVESVNLS